MRLLLKLFGALLLLATLGLVYATAHLGSLLKRGVETYAPPVLGTAVSVRQAGLLPLSGAGSLQGLAIHQPEGFGEGNAIDVAEVELALDLASLGSAALVLPQVLIDGLRLHYLSGAGGSNLQTLADGITRGGGAPGNDRGAQPPAAVPGQAVNGAPRLIIDRLTIRQAVLTTASPLLPGDSLGLPLPPIEMSGLGRAEGGLSPSQFAAAIAARLEVLVSTAIAESATFQHQLREIAQASQRRRAEDEVERALERQLGGAPQTAQVLR